MNIYIIGINLIDMAHTNFVTDINSQRFSQNMCCACYYNFLDFRYTFQVFVINIRLYLFLLYLELPQLQVSMLVLGATFVLFRFPGPCILIFFQILQMTSFCP